MSFKEWFTQEYDRDLEKRIKSAVRISMPPEDKVKTRDFLVSYMRMHPARIPTTPHTRWFAWSLHPYPIIAGLLIVALGGSSAGAASLAESALPGDFLYPIKVNVNEEVRAALATTPAKKADVAIARAERRIDELNALAARGEVSPEVIAAADERIDEHVHAAEVETALADDGEKERRLVAMLRIHENLISSSEVGGTIEPEVTFAATMAAPDTDVPEAVTDEADVALMVAMPAEDMAVTMQAVAPEEISRTSVARDARVRSDNLEENKKAEVQTKNIERQRKTAEQRIESLEKLLERKVSRYDEAVRVHAQNELSAARAALEEGNVFFEDELWGDATVRFNAAVRIAIDAREFLADAPKVEDGKKSDDRRESRSGRGRGGDDD